MLVGKAYMLVDDPAPAIGTQYSGFSDCTQYAKLLLFSTQI